MSRYKDTLAAEHSEKAAAVATTEAKAIYG